MMSMVKTMFLGSTALGCRAKEVVGTWWMTFSRSGVSPACSPATARTSAVIYKRLTLLRSLATGSSAPLEILERGKEGAGAIT